MKKIRNLLQSLLTNRNTPARIGIVLLLVFVTCISGTGAFALSRQLALGFGAISPSELLVSTSGVNAEGTPIPGGQLVPTPPLIAPSVKPWDGASRVTVLLLGLDYRDWASGENASRSDTMILLTLDPLSNSGGVLSIPRDLWVAIPGFKHGKINTAYYQGDAYQLPGGGPALAVKTVEEFLGVPINYFAQIDFGAFIRFIDEIGGVAVDVPEKITIDLLGSGFKTKKKLEPGRQVLPGEWALAYARARYSEGGDFDRAMRQQQVIMGIRERMLRRDMLPTIIAKAPALYNELASGIRTNLTLDQVIQLALLAQDVPDENIQRGIIGTESVLFAKSPDGLDILIPIPDKIFLLRDLIFASSSGLGPETPGSPQEQMVAEGAKIALYNSSHSPGALSRTADYLKGEGVLLSQTAESGQRYSSTIIIIHTGRPYTIKYLVDLLGIHPNNIRFQYDPSHPVDVEVYLGDDWANSGGP